MEKTLRQLIEDELHKAGGDPTVGAFLIIGLFEEMGISLRDDGWLDDDPEAISFLSRQSRP